MIYLSAKFCIPSSNHLLVTAINKYRIHAAAILLYVLQKNYYNKCGIYFFEGQLPYIILGPAFFGEQPYIVSVQFLNLSLKSNVYAVLCRIRPSFN
jgi:hypothetical protein